jgi:site-specific DNA recombinase
MTEAEMDEQIMALFARIKQPRPVGEGFQKMLRLWISNQQQESRSTADDIQRELAVLRDQQDRLLNLRQLDKVEAEMFARKNTESRDRIAALTLQLESAHRRRDERADLVQRVFELSQRLTERWIAANYAEKRQILEMVCLNFRLEGVTLGPEMRKPFDILVERLSVSSSRGDRIRTCDLLVPNQAF